MEFTWNWWLITTLAVYVFLFGLAVAVAAQPNPEYYGARQPPIRPTWKKTVIFVTIFFGSAIALNTASWYTTMYGPDAKPDENYVSYIEAANAFGLESGQAYPVHIGTRSGSAGGTSSASSGLLFSASSTSLLSGSTVAVGFASDQDDTPKQYILEVPVSKITFEIKPVTSPEATIVLQDRGSVLLNYTNYSYDNCRLVVTNLFFSHMCEETKFISAMDDDTQRHGLAPIVSKSIDSMNVVLSQEQYDALLGAA